MEEPTQPSKNKKPIAILATAAVVIIGGIVAFASGLFKLGDNDLDSAPAANDSTSTPVTSTPGTPQPAGSTKYKNGVYTLTQTYASPGGNEQFGLSMTISGDKVVSATFTPKPVSPTGQMFQGKFSTDFKQYVVGKNVDEVSISVISGASLTSAAFMKALASIKTQASASL